LRLGTLQAFRLVIQGRHYFAISSSRQLRERPFSFVSGDAVPLFRHDQQQSEMKRAAEQRLRF